MDMIDIPALSMQLSQINTLSGVQTAVLSQSLDMVETGGEMMTKSLESLANPDTMGTVIDMTV